jgi:hypothetical protein
MDAKMKAFYILSVALSLVLAAGTAGARSYGSSGGGWQDTFNLEGCDFSSTGANDYFVLVPGHQLVLQEKDGSMTVDLVITVLNETKMVGGTETRIVEERESENGEIVEISRNYFAVCGPANDVFYFGEDTDIYEDGKVANREGSWLAGVDNATAGLVMPGKPEVGMKYYQEVAPGIAEDRAEVLSLSEAANTPAGRFDHVLKTEETTPLDLSEKEFKFYAPGIGLVQEEDLKLVKYTAPKDASGGNGQAADDPESKQVEKRRALAAGESGEHIHRKHMQASPASVGEYSPGFNYTLEADGVASGETQGDAALTLDVSVWKSNGAVVILDVVGGTVKVGEKEYEVKLGYALYSVRHNVFRSSALAVAGDGDVLALRLYGTSGTAGAKLAAASGGEPVELAFKDDTPHRNKLGGWTLALDGTLQLR